MRADGFEVAHYADHVVVRQGDVFHVHHRRGEAVIDQQIADVVHVGKPVDVAIAIDFRKRLAQFFQGIRTEGAEHQQSIGTQNAVHFSKGAIQVVAPLQRKVRPNQPDACIFERQLLDIGTHIVAALLLQRQQALPPSGIGPRMRQHCPGNIGCNQLTVGVTFGQLLTAVAGTTARIENHLGFIFDELQPRQHTVADFALQHRRLVVTAGGTLKRGAQLLLVKNLSGIHRDEPQIVRGKIKTAHDRSAQTSPAAIAAIAGASNWPLPGG